MQSRKTESCSGGGPRAWEGLVGRVMEKGSRKGRLERFLRIAGFCHVSVSDQYPPSIHCPREIQAYKERTKIIKITSDSKDVTFSLTNECSGFKLSGENLWLATAWSKG